jgi:hypothetical protein
MHPTDFISCAQKGTWSRPRGPGCSRGGKQWLPSSFHSYPVACRAPLLDWSTADPGSASEASVRPGLESWNPGVPTGPSSGGEQMSLTSGLWVTGCESREVLSLISWCPAISQCQPACNQGMHKASPPRKLHTPELQAVLQACLPLHSATLSTERPVPARILFFIKITYICCVWGDHCDLYMCF